MQELECESGEEEEEKMDLAHQGQQEQLWVKIIEFNHLPSHVRKRALSSYHLEVNPQTLTQVPSLACMDHEDCLVRDRSRRRIKYAAAQSLFFIEVSLSLVSCWLR